jgi:hypothetical protein
LGGIAATPTFNASKIFQIMGNNVGMAATANSRTISSLALTKCTQIIQHRFYFIIVQIQ